MGGPWCLSVFGFRLSVLEMVFFLFVFLRERSGGHGCRGERLRDVVQE